MELKKLQRILHRFDFPCSVGVIIRRSHRRDRGSNPRRGTPLLAAEALVGQTEAECCHYSTT